MRSSKGPDQVEAQRKGFRSRKWPGEGVGPTVLVARMATATAAVPPGTGRMYSNVRDLLLVSTRSTWATGNGDSDDGGEMLRPGRGRDRPCFKCSREEKVEFREADKTAEEAEEAEEEEAE